MKWIFLLLIINVSGCATTVTGRGIDLVDEYKYAQALPYLEEGVSEGSKTAAIVLAFVYLSDFQVPVNLEKAKQYYQQVLALPPNLYDQYLDYFMPQVKALILLNDDTVDNDKEASGLLRQQKYARYSPSLYRLAKCYAFGTGVNKNNSIAHQLFERAIEFDHYQIAMLKYAWWLSVHPDVQFRDKDYARQLILSLDDFDDEMLFSVHNVFAAVYARNGQFDKATEYQSLAVKELSKQMDAYPAYGSWRLDYAARLEAYRSKKPWVEENVGF